MSPLTTCNTCNKEYSLKAPACVHCGEPNPTIEPAAAKTPWSRTPTGVIVWLLLFFPIGVLLMWKGKVFPVVVRILLTLLLLGAIAKAINPVDENDPLVQAVGQNLCPIVTEGSDGMVEAFAATGKMTLTEAEKAETSINKSFCGCLKTKFDQSYKNKADRTDMLDLLTKLNGSIDNATNDRKLGAKFVSIVHHCTTEMGENVKRKMR